MKVDIAKLQIVLDRAGRAELAKPFQAGGWLIGTCGRGLLAVRTDAGEPYSGESKTLVDGALKLIGTILGQQSVPLSDLRAIAKIPPDLPPCDRCKCTGNVGCKRCDGYGTIECECLECGNEHETKCLSCAGKGGTPCVCGWHTEKRQIAVVVIDGHTYDPVLIGEFLFAVTADTFRFSRPTETGPWVIGEDDWRLAIMPMQVVDPQKRADAPKLALPAAEGVPA